MDRTASLELKKLVVHASHVYETMRPAIRDLIVIIQRRAEQLGGEYVKYVDVLRSYLDVVQCDLLCYDFENSI